MHFIHTLQHPFTRIRDVIKVLGYVTGIQMGLHER
jgi:hypothetical protein